MIEVKYTKGYGKTAVEKIVDGTKLSVDAESGVLTVSDSDGNSVAVYAAGQWASASTKKETNNG